MEDDYGLRTYFDPAFERSYSALEDRLIYCRSSFDKDRDGMLNLEEFSSLCRALFRTGAGSPYPLDANKVTHMFSIFDTDEDGFLDNDELEECLNEWVTRILRPITAIVVVDVQNDFISGSLAVSNCPAKHNGEEVVPVINSLVDSVRFSEVVYSLDWHPSDHLSFVTNVKNFPMHSSSKVTAEEAKVLDTVVFDEPVREQKLWPPHCVQDSWGAELHPKLKVTECAIKIKKGRDREIESYSAFFDNAKGSSTGLADALHGRNVSDVFVCGLATDVCVAATALDALSEGFRTIVIEDACRGVDEGDIEKKMAAIRENNGVIVHSAKVGSIVAGQDRPPELGYQLALEFAKNH